MAAGWIGLAVMLALAGCGQSDPQAALEVSSVPAAQIYVDGASHGTSPATIALSAGEHQVELRLEKFESFQTTVLVAANQTAQIDAALTPQDPSDPDVVALLAQANGIDVAPFVAPELTRGRAGQRTAAVLLWPSRDVRAEGLTSFAIEADETYGGDAALEFRCGRKVLHSEPFNPESVTTVRSLPAAVVEAAEVNAKITWGLYYEDRRRPITTEFRVVQRKKAEKQLESLATSRHMARQPEITQQILRAAVLENNRLYSEALVLNLSIAANHPGSTQPYRGIVTTLRRLDAEGSELFAFVAPHVSGRGGRSGLSPRPAAGGLGIEAWAPVVDMPSAPKPTLASATPTAKPIGPGGQGVTPTAPADAPEAGSPQEPTAGTAAVDPRAQATRDQIDLLTREHAEAQAQFERATAEAADAARQAAEAADHATQAEAEAAAARAALEQATEPTREQQEAVSHAESAAQDARRIADEAGRQAHEAEAALRLQEAALDAQSQAIQDLKRTLGPEGAPVEPTVPVPGQSQADPGRVDTSALQGQVEQAQQQVESAQSALASAQADHEAALDAFQANPGRDTQTALDEAAEALESARSQAEQAQKDLQAAVAALARVGDPAAPPAR